MVPGPDFVTLNGATTGLIIYQISVNITTVIRIALQNRSLGCGVVVRSKFQSC